MELFRLFGSVMIDNQDAINKLKESDKRARESSRMFSKMGDAAKKVGKVVAVGVAAGATALVGMAQKSAATADAIHKGSQRMGVSMKGYQELEYWASQNGLAQDQLEKGVGRLNQRMGLAAEGNEKYAEALQAVGIDMEGVKNGTLSTEDAFAQSIKTLSEMENEQEKAALASELFGTKLGRDLLPTLQDGSLSLEDAKKKAHEMGMVLSDDSVNAGVKFTDTMDTLKRTLGGFVTKIGAAVIPKLQQFLDWIIANMPLIKEKTKAAIDGAKLAIDKMKESIQYLQERANVLIPVLAGLVGAIAAFKIITGIASAISKMKLLMTAWKTTTFATTLAQSGLNAALLANPIGLVIAAIAALIAIGVALYMNMDGFREKTNQVFGFIKSFVLSAVGIVVSFVRQQLAVLSTFWKQNGAQIMGIVRATWSIIQTIVRVALNIMVTVFKGQFMVIVGAVKIAWNIIKTVIKVGTSLVLGIVKTFLAIFRGDWRGAWNTIVSTFKNIWDTIRAFLSSTLRNIGSIIKGMMSSYKAIVSSVLNGIWAIFVKIWSSIRSSVVNILQGLRAASVSVFNSMRSAISSAVNGIRSVVSRVFSGLRSAITNPIQSAKSTVLGIIGAIKGAFSNMRISIPKPKLPNVNVSMGSKKVGGISIPYPKFSVAWHAKGGIFDRPTLFNTPGGLHGVGEAGPEAILPLNKSTLGGIGDGIARNMSMQSMINKLDTIADLLRDQDYQIVMQNGALVGALRKEIDRQLGHESGLKGRGRA
ncbi:hypothetical protein [Exiguobacterium sp. s63]|uniref:phage tail protein n=1 Tax=Exiguobacterium sp. s63 TaxID=2751274 RepID=UPI001BE798E1|nr:hypothetical protein [Exiguobacterium sp. s63]